MEIGPAEALAAKDFARQVEQVALQLEKAAAEIRQSMTNWMSTRHHSGHRGKAAEVVSIVSNMIPNLMLGQACATAGEADVHAAMGS